MHYTITLLQLQLSSKFRDLLKVNQLHAPYRKKERDRERERVGEKFVPKWKTKLQLVLVHFLCTALQIFYFVSLLELILCRSSDPPTPLLCIYIFSIYCAVTIEHRQPPR